MVNATNPPHPSLPPPVDPYPGNLLPSTDISRSSSPTIVAHASSSKYENHPTFYFDDEIVTFLVEDRVKFRVHRHFLRRDSTFFCGFLGSTPNGPENSYVVQKLKCEEFESLLGFFYDGMYHLSPSAIPIRSWVNLLSISTQFTFPKAREHAIAAIDVCQLGSQNCLGPAEMINIAVKFDVQKWIRPALIELSEREAPIQLAEAEKIGIERLVKLTEAREALLRDGIPKPRRRSYSSGRPCSPPSLRPPSPLPSPAERIVDSVFFANDKEDYLPARRGPR